MTLKLVEVLSTSQKKSIYNECPCTAFSDTTLAADLPNSFLLEVELEADDTRGRIWAARASPHTCDARWDAHHPKRGAAQGLSKQPEGLAGQMQTLLWHDVVPNAGIH